MSAQWVPVASLLPLLLLVAANRVWSYGECEFPDRHCGWNWSERWNLVSAQNITAQELGTTAPDADAQKNAKGQLSVLFKIYYIL